MIDISFIKTQIYSSQLSKPEVTVETLRGTELKRQQDYKHFDVACI